MYSDSASLSALAGDFEPCLLPLSANITDFPVRDTESSLSSFQSSLVTSLQSSLTHSPTSLALSPPHISTEAIPIIPRPLVRPTSSTPVETRRETRYETRHFASNPDIFLSGDLITEGVTYTSGFLGSTMGETVVSDIFAVPTVLLSRIDDEIMTTVTMTDQVPQVTEADLAFVDSTRVTTTNTVVMKDEPVVELEEADAVLAMEQQEDDVVLVEQQAPEDDKPNYISYEQFAQMFAHLGPPSTIDDNEDLFDLYYRG